MDNLKLETYGVQQLSTREMKRVDGGGFWAEAFKTVAIDILYEGAKALGKAAVADWNSRTGAPRNMTSTYASNPYH